MCNERRKLPDERTSRRLDFVHADLAGPISHAGKGGHTYVLLFANDLSRFMSVYVLKCKSDTVKATEKFVADIAPCGGCEKVTHRWRG